MKVLNYTVAGDPVHVYVPDCTDDLDKFEQWVSEQPVLALDTETTGLELFSSDFRIRTIQFGVESEAWVIPVEESPVYGAVARAALADEDKWWILHHASYDIIALEQAGYPAPSWDRVRDTKILAHLIDPRGTEENGTGLKLEDLTRAYIDTTVADEVKHSITTMAHNNGITKGQVFSTIPLRDDMYNLYAGMDVILTARLLNILQPLIPSCSQRLIQVEHDIARICAQMETTGFLLDWEYARDLGVELEAASQQYADQLKEKYGVQNAWSNNEVAEALIAQGVKLKSKTATGKWKLNKEVMEPLVEEGNEIALWVTEARKARKWNQTWVQKFLQTADKDWRCHATINPLQARTGRMSITGIPAQTLPSSDWKIRRCFIADPGETIVSCDYQAQELRVLAALSGDETMKHAFETGADLHQITADASGVDRKVGKTVNFAYVYGSGPYNIAKTCGITVPKAKAVIEGFEAKYPKVKLYAKRLQDQAKAHGYIVTPAGRRIPVDPDRAYAALNYMIQSTSRDITAAALLRLDQAGLTRYLRLPIHDEIVASVPEGEAETLAKEIAATMKTGFAGVEIDTDCEIYGPSWGHGYMDKT